MGVVLLALLLGTASPARADRDPGTPARPGPMPPSSERTPLAPLQRWVRVAERVRASVVTIQWKDQGDRAPHKRNAVLHGAKGHLITAGAPIRAWPGTLTARLADGQVLKARVLADDPTSGLSVLHIHARMGQSLPWRGHGPGSLPAPPVTSPATTPAPPPLTTLPMGLEVGMVSGDGGLALSRIRAVDREVPLLAPGAAAPVRVGGLVEAGLSAIPHDVGAPWVDREGRLVALQLSMGLGRPGVQADDDAVRRGVHLRPSVTACRAVPISVVAAVIPQLLERREVLRAGLGIVTAAADEATRIHLCEGHGCHVVQSVAPDSPGARAGLRPHDLILGVNGRSLRPHARLQDILLPFRPGDRIRLAVRRGGKTVALEVVLARRDEGPR